MVPPCPDPASIWLDAPCAALQLWRDADGPRWRLNRAAIEWSLRQRLADGDWQAFADALLQDLQGPLVAEGRASVGAMPLRWRAAALAPGWLLWLMPETPAGADEADAADKLALLQLLRPRRLHRTRSAQRSGRWDS